MEEHEKCKKNEPSTTSMPQMVLNIFNFEVGFGQNGHRHFIGFHPY